MDRLTAWRVGTALAITFAAIYIVCATAFALWPGGTLGFFNAWFHGLNLAGLQTGAKPFDLSVFVYGFIGVGVFAFVAGAVFAGSYNLLRR